MSSRAELFLGIIAFAMLATSIVQIGVLVVAGLLVRRVHRLVDQVERDLKPVFDQVSAIARDASRAAALAAAQVERVDRMMADVTERLDRILGAVQSFVTGPLKNGVSLFAGVRTVVDFLRDLRSSRARPRAEDEDTLFI